VATDADPSAAGSGTRQTELGALLAGTVTAVVEAQDLLDEHARSRAAEYAAAEPGSLALPPLWYAFDEASIDLELSTEAVRVTPADGGPARTHLLCRTVNPVTVGVYGYRSAAGTRVRLTLTPQRVVPAPRPAPEEGPPSP
jgi:hypothetical protein